MPLKEIVPGLWRSDDAPLEGELGQLWDRFSPYVIFGHPAFHNERTIGRLLEDGIRSAPGNFPGLRVSFVVSDGTLTEKNHDFSTLDSAEDAARRALGSIPAHWRERIQVVLLPYDGYCGDHTSGKGSALHMVFREMERCRAKLLVLLDSDLHNDLSPWHEVFALVEQKHHFNHPGRPFFVTARYARHFLDASITRFVVGPLTTLMGCYVPGGISGDIALSHDAVAHERAAVWGEARRRFGTDIATTFDNIAHERTVIYEVFLGVKLHDITDEAKLSVMPGEVIGAALERLLHYERERGLVSRVLAPDTALRFPVCWGPERTRISFVDPGAADLFDVDDRIDTLVARHGAYAPAIAAVLGEARAAELEARVGDLGRRSREDGTELRFLDLDAGQWCDIMGRAVAHALHHGEVEAPRLCMAYFYTAAFLEHLREVLGRLGQRTLGQVRRAQSSLAAPQDSAEAFYEQHVDGVARDLALRFFEGRGAIRQHLRRLSG